MSPIAIFDTEEAYYGGPVIVPDLETATLHVRAIQVQLNERPVMSDLPGPSGGKHLWFAHAERGIILHDAGDLNEGDDE